MSEQSFIKYITNFARNATDSCSVPWYDNYFKPISKDKAPYSKNEFQKIRNRVVSETDSENDFFDAWTHLGHSITRNDIFKLFANESDESLYRGYVAAMLWGGIGTGGGTSANLISAMSQPKSQILDRISNVKKVMASGTESNVKAAFMMMTKKYGTEFDFDGTNIQGAKIPGIDINYFTKLLFFLGNKNWECQPLVYDNQLQNVHCALLKDAGIDLASLFEVHSFKMDSSLVSCRVSPKMMTLSRPADFYVDFIKRVKSLAESIEIAGDCEFQGKAGRLEEIMFGKELSRKKSKNDPMTNPRAFVRNYLGITQYSDDLDDQDNSEVRASSSNEIASSQTKHKPKKERNITILDLHDVLTVRSHELELFVGKDDKGYLCKYKFRHDDVDKHVVFKDTSVLSLLNGAQRRIKYYDYKRCATIEEACRVFEQVKEVIMHLQQ